MKTVIKMEKFQIPNLMSVRQFLEANPAFTNGSLRRWISLAAINGMNERLVLFKIYGKIYINCSNFFDWFNEIASQNREVIARI